MLDFMTISTVHTRKGMEIAPKFLMKKSKDMMVRGGDFYAIWDEEQKMWSTDEDDVVRLIDNELRKFVEEKGIKTDNEYTNVKYMWDSDSGMIDKWHKYCQKQCRDNYSMLDEELIFSNTELSRDKHASKKLDYPLEAGSISAYDKLMSTLYSEEERHKLEWAVGSIVSGDSKHIQKFVVLYGAAGAGKSTFLNIVEQLFKGYYATFDAKALGSANASFALEPFTANPLVAIQHDGDLSRIEDNTRLNSLVSHEEMPVNEKFKRTYPMRFKCFLFMGTNRPVKITDGKSGLLRRLIDVTPSGNKVSQREYKTLTNQIPFELGAIAKHCLDVYLEDPDYYDNYMPKSMLSASNDFYNFIMDSYSVFKKENGTTLKAAWEMYRVYCDEAKLTYPCNKRTFKEELKNYFWDYDDKVEGEDGLVLRSYYSEFKTDIFEDDMKTRSTRKEDSPSHHENHIFFECQESVIDKEYSDCPAQYASTAGTPSRKWENVTTKLSDLDTSQLHYVKIPENHIVIDFDIKDENGNKSFERNLEEASKWPPTYAELSKSGGGIHLHYIYTGDTSQLSYVYDDNIEIKVFNGNSSLRRKLSKCNNLPIATINSGLPLKEGGKTVINFDGIKNEKILRNLIKRHMNKEIMGATKPSIDMIYKCLEEAYESGIGYDVSDMKNAIYAFAMSSTNQSDTCLKIVGKMKFKSEEVNETTAEDETYVFYDVEVFKNLFIVCYKFEGEDKPVIKLINPTPAQIEDLIRFRLIGFNNRKYDDHILYARLMGYSNEALYELSQKIITEHIGFFGEAYRLSFADVYDFSSKKQSLKKWEIELGISHVELGIPWDQEAPEELWETIAGYCCNDVRATEYVFHNRHADFLTRKIVSELSGLPVIDTNRMHINRIIFGPEKKPILTYTDLATGEQSEGR